MEWINEHHSKWRIILLVIMVVAFLGPWGFEKIHVPAKYPCNAPFVRIEGDFCGQPISGVSLYPWVIISFFTATVGLVSGDLTFIQWINGFLIFIPVLPVFSTLSLVLREENERKKIFVIITWVLAIGVALFWGLNNYPKVFWLSWGIWFYICLAISALILETIVLTESRKLNSKSVPAPHS